MSLNTDPYSVEVIGDSVSNVPPIERSSLVPLVIVGVAFVILIIIVLISIIISYNRPLPQNISSEQYGVIPMTDGIVTMTCGGDHSSPCSFIIGTISEAINQCNTLGNGCQAFSYNPITSTMKVITPSTIFSSNNQVFIRSS